MFDTAEYPTSDAFRDWNPASPASASRTSASIVGTCIERSLRIFAGDLAIYDSAVEIRSGDVVSFQSTNGAGGPFTKGLLSIADEHRPGKRNWWFHCDDGLFEYSAELHAVVSRLLFVAHRRRDLPLPEALQREHDAIVLSTNELRAELERRSLRAMRLIKRDGLDRTTVFRKAAQAEPRGGSVATQADRC